MGDLVVSGGATTAVAPEELERAGVLLRRLSAEASSIAMELASIDRIATRETLREMGAPTSALEAENDIDQATIVLGEVTVIADLHGQALQFAADGYTTVEQFVRVMFGSGMGDLASAGGALSRLGPLGLILAGGAAAAASNPQLRGHPFFVNAVRESVMSSDDALLGYLGVPRVVSRALGDEGLGLTGASTTAAVLAGVGGAVGLVQHTPVRLTAESVPTEVRPVEGAEGRLDRVPTPTDGDGAQITIERYEYEGKPDAFIAYVAGTATFDPFVTDEPLDMESNVLNMVDGSSASAEALRQALAAAGADASSQVQLVGYSQGGAADARVAESGDFDVQGILTFGSPTGQIELPTDITAILVEHDDDLVPATGGRQDNQSALLVNRRVYDDWQVPADQPVPAHLRSNYAETARMMDASTGELRSTIDALDSLTQGATRVTSTNYEFERITGSASVSGRS
ncbi:MAG TPA: hypothetical protein PL156_02850 [Rhodoglobus sp.]|mgnify:FL=1|nr:hypothetical protein [Rhodoglobus sp.]